MRHRKATEFCQSSGRPKLSPPPGPGSELGNYSNLRVFHDVRLVVWDP